ncbi:MAG: hypothetical protein KKA42_01855 [candidate division Zixibacteria bacterium]|nr:hypothetical protein [candidate division Zixibacteria bacterium]
MMIRRVVTGLVAAGVLLLAGCGAEDLPSRDEIPILRERLFALEQAVKADSRASVDSLLSVKILDRGQDSDSLLRYVYGSDHSFAFERLGDYHIFYNKKVAVIDCFVMDSTAGHDRPLKLTFEKVDDLWLLGQFEAGAGRP